MSKQKDVKKNLGDPEEHSEEIFKYCEFESR
jgi:hypothetical protein